MDTIKINKGPVRRRKNHFKRRLDNSSTIMMILKVVRMTGRRGVGFGYFSPRKILIFRRSNGKPNGCRKKMGPKDNTFIWLIQRQDAEDTATGPVWIPSARKISTWTTDMAPLDKTSSPCQQE
ncbi:hypothetical protein LEMLEM_LOCUS17831, partial [Lemmus lemmus]